jgi:hypothetical protein
MKSITELFNMEKINEINTRYRHGRIRMTPAARVILFILKIYIFIMLCLLAVKFIRILTGGGL